MATSKFYDSFTLYVKSGVAYQHQLIESLRKAVAEASKIIGEPLETKYKVNLIMLRDNKPVGYGYIRVTNPKVYNILSGLNPDGTERCELYDDPDWKPPSYDIDDLNSSDWADESPDNCPKLKRPLPPIVTLDGYTLDEKQKIMYKDQFIETSKHDGTYKDGMKIVIPDKDNFEISQAFVYKLEDNLCSNVLCARKIPLTINETMLKNFFASYASNNKTKVTRRNGNKTFEDTYPFVTINSERIAFVTFDPKTHDGQFALLMTKKVEMSDGDKPVVLIFTHSFRTK